MKPKQLDSLIAEYAKRYCACGCGRKLQGSRGVQRKYADNTCQSRAWKRGKRASERASMTRTEYMTPEEFNERYPQNEKG